MMRSLIINKPQDPVKFLIDKLEKPASKSLYQAKALVWNYLEIDFMSCLRDCEGYAP